MDLDMSSPARALDQLSVDSHLVAEARELKIDVSVAAAEGIAQAIRTERERLWLLENAEAIRQSNEYVERHGLPLAKYRAF
ncbi:antitoxin CcdA [Pararhizobium capsulatum DSM 1112]|uniref:Antitoxin CcdA n=1 Tax=Pararhizobium capsulatum DSM 1112 TaxID=1121113 RepID=A0ABU0BJE9_9HYPH|nr:type II toxin-antitoxin system CcdA family antitoxin [Pararhizobium capsulatum]MDQ0318387.1 antitoxin CcdA [Pararhizobium capsulatum DSM 1112]